jgi:hypothetical protein
MKNILIGLAMLTAVDANAVENCVNGSYYDPANPGEGLVLDVNEDYVSAYLFTYDYPAYLQNGTLHRDWFTAYTPNSGNQPLPMTFYKTDNIGFPSTNVTNTTWAQSLLFVDDDKNGVYLSIDVNFGAWPYCDFSPVPFFCSRQLHLTRLINTKTVECQE